MDSRAVVRAGSLAPFRTTRREQRWTVLLVFVLLTAVPAAAAPAATASVDTTLFRIFLHDGTPLVSYGEFARVGDRVIFSMPTRSDAKVPDLRLVQIPASSVDWTRTDRYADSIRYQHYATTRGAADYAVLTGQVASALDAMTHESNPAARLKTAETIRHTVVDWPRGHFGYRADDVREILELLDETIAGLRASSGEQHFALSLVAGIAPPQVEPVLPPPTPQEAIAQVLTIARLSASASQRISLLQLAMNDFDAHEAALPREWAKATRRDTERLLDQETRWTRDYRDLVKTALDDASHRASRADVRGVEAVLSRVRRRDADWGHHRPEEVASLMTSLQAQLDAARRLKLARDRWRLRERVIDAYENEIHSVLSTLDQAHDALDAIKTLAGPDAEKLSPLEEKMAAAVRQLTIISPPAEMTSAHALLTSAARLAEQAAAIRLDATLKGHLDRAWDASSAAAGSLMLFDRARHELETQSQPPTRR
ncbi:MAG TPA: hypothetical protein VFK20_02540 [Vicinamibacterales bacterium]|nr:hypothetical protein [Vicinamibacterales bacterium]